MKTLAHMMGANLLAFVIYVKWREQEETFPWMKDCYSTGLFLFIVGSVLLVI